MPSLEDLVALVLCNVFIMESYSTGLKVLAWTWSAPLDNTSLMAMYIGSGVLYKGQTWLELNVSSSQRDT